MNKEIPGQSTVIGGYKMRGIGILKWLSGGGTTSKSSKVAAPPVSSYLDGEPADDAMKLQPASKQYIRSKGIPLVGAGISTFWHEWQMCRIGRGLEPDLEMNWFWGGLIREGLWYGLILTLWGKLNMNV